MMPFAHKIHNSRYGLLAVVPAILMLNLLTEQLDLSDNATPVIIQLMHSTWGIIFVALLGPVIEELIFRLAILGSLLRWTHINPWISIVISASLFTLAHWNPAQTPVALAMGVILGTFYWRSGLWLCLCVHIFNNSLAVAEYKISPYFSLTDSIGGPIPVWAVIILCTYIVLSCMHRYMDETNQIKI